MTDPALPAERLSVTLQRLLQAAGGRGLAIGEMIEILQGRGLQAVVILLCLPFLSPVTIPGISIPFGLAIALSGVRLALGRKPWLPQTVLRRRISYPALEKMVQVGCSFYGRLEKLVRPRWLFVFEGPGMLALLGATITVAGIFLSLPIPPPFPLTNTIPGLAIILFSLGLMERDGRLVLAGYGLTLLTAVYLGVIAVAGKAGILHFWGWLTGA